MSLLLLFPETVVRKTDTVTQIAEPGQININVNFFYLVHHEKINRGSIERNESHTRPQDGPVVAEHDPGHHVLLEKSKLRRRERRMPDDILIHKQVRVHRGSGIPINRLRHKAKDKILALSGSTAVTKTNRLRHRQVKNICSNVLKNF